MIAQPSLTPPLRAVMTAPADQWLKALDRAISEALDVLIEPISGEAFIESGSTPGLLYAVSAATCTCPAFRQFGRVCKHMAAYLYQIGEFPVPVGDADIDTVLTRHST